MPPPSALGTPGRGLSAHTTLASLKLACHHWPCLNSHWSSANAGLSALGCRLWPVFLLHHDASLRSPPPLGAVPETHGEHSDRASTGQPPSVQHFPGARALRAVLYSLPSLILICWAAFYSPFYLNQQQPHHQLGLQVPLLPVNHLNAHTVGRQLE